MMWRNWYSKLTLFIITLYRVYSCSFLGRWLINFLDCFLIITFMVCLNDSSVTAWNLISCLAIFDLSSSTITALYNFFSPKFFRLSLLSAFPESLLDSISMSSPFIVSGFNDESLSNDLFLTASKFIVLLIFYLNYIRLL